MEDQVTIVLASDSDTQKTKIEIKASQYNFNQ